MSTLGVGRVGRVGGSSMEKPELRLASRMKNLTFAVFLYKHIYMEGRKVAGRDGL